MKLFRVRNIRGNAGMYFAASEEQACSVAFEQGRARRLQNLTAKDITDQVVSHAAEDDPSGLPSLQRILRGDQVGHAMKAINGPVSTWHCFSTPTSADQ